tara:strand:- start:230 stop:469 length:240 start_codon:yes stop_codon:yes gene_type:complete
MNLDQALSSVNGQLIDLINHKEGDAFTYPTAIAIVKRDHALHPFVVWRAIDPSRSGNDPFFESGNYYETLAEALTDSRI